ncbi:hypothetical protein J2X72_003391 [Phyllobacterium sp. 1468]|nr:hypothetical protein [Phyllobacterium sp. 1468]
MLLRFSKFLYVGLQRIGWFAGHLTRLAYDHRATRKDDEGIVIAKRRSEHRVADPATTYARSKRSATPLDFALRL